MKYVLKRREIKLEVGEEMEPVSHDLILLVERSSTNREVLWIWYVGYKYEEDP